MLQIGKIDFPFYNAFGRCGYYLPADKSIYIPIRYKFVTAGGIKAAVEMPDGTRVDAKSKIEPQELMDVMENAVENDASLFEQPAIRTRMQLLADSVYRALGEESDDLVFSKKESHRPVFLWQDGQLIGITDRVVFDINEDGRLTITLKSAKGPFLRAFETDEDKETSIIMLDEDGEDVLFNASTLVDNIHGNDITALKQKNRAPAKELADKCISIYQQYQDNFMNYFLDKEEELEGGLDFEPEDLFKEGE